MTTLSVASLADLYAEHRGFLWSLCYRMVGSAADADDVVQDTFVRVMEAPPPRTEEPLRPWLVRVAMNRARDVLRRRKRRGYVGPWLPSPIETEPPSYEPQTLAGRYDLIESVSFAFLLALETFSPSQRAVLILRDVFDYSVSETADGLGMSEANVKTTHHRARRALTAYDQQRQPPTKTRADATGEALAAFLRALDAHDVAAVETLLAADVKATTDGGGEFTAALRTVVGRDKVTRFYLGLASRARGVRSRLAFLNGLPAIIAEVPDPPPGVSPRFALGIALDATLRISHIYFVSATRKLTAVK